MHIVHLTNFDEATIGPDVDFDHANMSFVKAKKIYLENCQFTDTDLRESVFDHAMIRNTTFKQSLMIKISMQFSNVINGDFSQTNLFAANWQSIRCEQCVFNHTNMINVNLYNAVFIESDFQNCYLSEKQLKQAKFFNCTMM